MRSTIYTVADKADVSIATVSRVLNNKPSVKEETRAKVLKVMEELKYQPSVSPRERALNKTEIMALVFPDISGPFYSEVIRGVTSEANQYGYSLLIYGTHHTSGGNAQFLRLLPTKVDGLILMARSVEDKYIFHLHERRIPFVLLDCEVEGIQVDSILVDNFDGAYKAVEHLIQHGYSQIAFISGPADSPDSNIRFDAYRQVLQDHGMPLLPRLVEQGDFLQPGGYHAMSHLLDRLTSPIAVFVANDEMAIGAFEAVRGRGLVIPDDVVIIGFDDIQMAPYTQPPLTTVKQPIHELGVLAVRKLLQRIDDPEIETETIVQPTRLIIRRSCGCVP